MENGNSDNPTLDNARLEMQNYTINEHIHKYAVWTAARAVQRGFKGATTERISKAIDSALLKDKFLLANDEWNDDSFKKAHNDAIKILKDKLNCTYGRAAKIIAIYIKTSVILPNKGKCSLSKVAYPPIDDILLSSLKKIGIIESYERWTKIDDKEGDSFFDIISKIREEVRDKPLWQIEFYWNPNKNEED